MATIHPYKGYLNTEFQLLSYSDKEVSFTIFHNGSESAEAEGLLKPNIPQRIKLSVAGQYDVVFSDNSKSEILVQDGYKFGGGSHKAFFIFDECPWLFVVMKDRTYFHNRETGEEYVEVVSPDSIIEVSREYVLMQNIGQDEVTLYSLIDQKPIICVSNVIFYNHNYLVWRVEDIENDKQELVIYSLSQKEEINRLDYDALSLDKSKEHIHVAYNDQIHTIDISSQYNIEEQTFSPKGTFGAFAQINYVVFVEKSYKKTEMVVYDLDNQTEKNRIVANGCIARINDNEIINISKRKQSIQNFDKVSAGFPEAVISASYSEYDIYPCRTDTFYKEQVSDVSSESRSIQTSRTLKSAGSQLNESIGVCNNVIINDQIICIYGSQKESVVIPLNYLNHIHHDHNGTIRHHKGQIILEKEGEYVILSRKGFWNSAVEGDFDFEYFKDFGIIIDKKSHKVANSSLGEFIVYNRTKNYIKTENGRISNDGSILWINKKEHIPTQISPKFKYGIEIEEGKVLLYTYQNKSYGEPKIILESLYDTSKFSHVYLSEDGHQLLHRNNEVYRMIDLDSGTSTEFDNLSFVSHINGLRPQFRLIDDCQAILINPMNGLPIDTYLLDEYQFVSPDGKLFADKALDKYTEYYDLIQEQLISKEQYLELIKRYTLSTNKTKRIENLQNRKDFVQLHSAFLINVLREKGYKERPIKDFHEALIDEKNTYGVERFLDYFIERRGVAVVRKTEDKSEIARIKLGKPLWYLNYVSFSYNNRYVAIAGKYPGDSGYSGLFLVYDLVEKRSVFDSKSTSAVWTTAFTKEGTVAAYTSSPNSIICDIKTLQEIENIKEKRPENRFPVRGVNFLTFSSDGSMFACSRQGYIPYRKKDGTLNVNWGHQPSSLVSIRKVVSPNEEIISFSDLSDEGIDGFKKSVSSVSFSNDNRRLMMVGKDGCMIVRNLHL